MQTCYETREVTPECEPGRLTWVSVLMFREHGTRFPLWASCAGCDKKVFLFKERRSWGKRSKYLIPQISNLLWDYDNCAVAVWGMAALLRSGIESVASGPLSQVLLPRVQAALFCKTSRRPSPTTPRAFWQLIPP